MKKLIPLIILGLFFTSCAKKNYLERSDEDKALQDAVRKLNKNATDEKALIAAPILYSNVLKTHQARIASYNTGRDVARWDKIITEYQFLQDAYDVIINSNAAFRLITPQNYSAELLDAKDKAAREYYILAQNFFNKEGRANARQAYNYFAKANKFVPGYKDSRTQMDLAYQNAIVDVIINPVQDNSFFMTSGWGSTGISYSNEYFQQTLVRELQNTNNSTRYPARFYTDWQARTNNVQPDWVIDLSLTNMNIPYPSNYTYNRNVNAQVRNGSDTAGKPTYTTVYATVHITRASFIAKASMIVNISDLASGKSINYRVFNDDYSWQEEKGSYSGDSRALSTKDWAVVNNNNYNTPRREDILGELYRKLYPQVKDNISYAVSW